MNMQLFFGRLREEREARGLTQDAMAKNVGVSKRSYCAYEAGETAPSAKLLAALASMGVDVAYLLTGQRTPTSHLSVVPAPPLRPDVNAEEARLLSDFRLCDAQGKAVIRAASRAAAQAAGAHPPSRRRRSG